MKSPTNYEFIKPYEILSKYRINHVFEGNLLRHVNQMHQPNRLRSALILSTSLRTTIVTIQLPFEKSVCTEKKMTDYNKINDLFNNLVSKYIKKQCKLDFNFNFCKLNTKHSCLNDTIQLQFIFIDKFS